MSQSRFSCGYDSDSSDDYGDYSDQDCSQSLFPGSRRFENSSKWTKEEDDKLRNAVEYHGSNDWKAIAGYVDRNELQCIQRWQKVLNPDLVKGPWTKEEDDMIAHLVGIYGPRRWSFIAEYLPGRIGKQCRERWHNHLNPAIKKCAWTVEEDRIIYEAHKRLGNKWAEIAKLLPGRTDNSIKNHWNSTMKRKAESKANPYSPRNQIACNYRYAQASTAYPVYISQSNANLAAQPTNCQDSSLRSILQTNMRRNTLPSTSTQISDRVNAQESPMRWIVMDNEGIISPFRDLPDITDTNFLEQDPRLDDLSTFDMLLGDDSIGATPIKFTKLHQKGATGYRFDGHAISNLSKDTSGRLIPITSPVTSKYSTPPTILRKKRRRSHLDTSTRSSNSSLLKTPDVKQSCKDSTTPKTTPIKPLTFSPSQFFNLHSPIGIGLTPCKQQLTSTPISKVELSTSSLLCTPQLLTQTPSNKENVPDGFFRTPKIRRALLETPRTPTPLKDALAALEKKGGRIHRLPQTPDHFVEDLTEIIKKDEEMSGLKSISSPLKRKQKKSITPTKRVRKTLSHQWVDEKKSTNDYFFTMPGTTETPSSQYPNPDSNAIIRQLFRDSSSLLTDDTNMGGFTLPSLEHFSSEPALLTQLLPPTNTNQCAAAAPSNITDLDRIAPQVRAQSSSLLAESSLLTSPDGTSKELLNSSSGDSFSVTLDQGFIAPVAQTSISKYRANKSLRDFKRFNETPFKPSIKLNRAWEAVACGQTADQLILIQQAKKYLFSNMRPRSLKL